MPVLLPSGRGLAVNLTISKFREVEGLGAKGGVGATAQSEGTRNRIERGSGGRTKSRESGSCSDRWGKFWLPDTVSL